MQLCSAFFKPPLVNVFSYFHNLKKKKQRKKPAQHRPMASSRSHGESVSKVRLNLILWVCRIPGCVWLSHTAFLKNQVHVDWFCFKSKPIRYKSQKH